MSEDVKINYGKLIVSATKHKVENSVLRKALTKIKSHKGCIAVIRRIAEDALKEVEG